MDIQVEVGDPIRFLVEDRWMLGIVNGIQPGKRVTKVSYSMWGGHEYEKPLLLSNYGQRVDHGWELYYPAIELAGIDLPLYEDLANKPRQLVTPAVECRALPWSMRQCAGTYWLTWRNDLEYYGDIDLDTFFRPRLLDPHAWHRLNGNLGTWCNIEGVGQRYVVYRGRQRLDSLPEQEQIARMEKRRRAILYEGMLKYHEAELIMLKEQLELRGVRVSNMGLSHTPEVQQPAVEQLSLF